MLERSPGRDGPHGPEYELTEAGQEAGDFGERPRHLGTALAQAREPSNEDLDLEPVLVDMQRRVHFPALPKAALWWCGSKFAATAGATCFSRRTKRHFANSNPGFPEPVCVRGPLAALVAWWRGDMSFVEAQRMGLAIEGPKAFTRAFPKWFDALSVRPHRTSQCARQTRVLTRARTAMSASRL